MSFSKELDYSNASEKKAIVSEIGFTFQREDSKNVDKDSKDSQNYYIRGS